MNKNSYNSPLTKKQKARSLPTSAIKGSSSASSPMSKSSRTNVQLNLDVEYIPYIII